MGGSWSGGVNDKDAEIFDPAGTWTKLTGVPVAPIYTKEENKAPTPLRYRADNHAWLFGWSNAQGVRCNVQDRARNMLAAQWLSFAGAMLAQSSLITSTRA